MHITFIKPTLGCLADGDVFVDEARMEPLSLGVLAGLTPAGVDCTLVDDRIDVIDYDAKTDLVAINVETFTARRAYEISAEYRQRGVPVIMGGMHATLLPQEVAEHADSVFTGDAEPIWAQVVRDARDKALKPAYHGDPGTPQPGALTRRDIYAGKGYLPVSLLQFGRGCRFRCDFCAVTEFFDHCNYTRPVEEVVAEIRSQKRRNLFFVDDNLVSDVSAAKELLRVLIPLKVRWVSQVSLDHTEDPELMQLMQQSGCLGNVIGFESLSADSLKQARKAANLRGFDQYQRAIQTLRDYHLQTWAAFTLGYDHDTYESLLATCDWAIDQKFAFAAFNVLMPYPGTGFYNRLQEEGRLLYDGKWWLHPDYRFNHAAYIPAKMTPDQLTEAGWQCRKHWSSPSSIFKRMFDFKTHLSSPLRLFLYLLYNPLFRQEAFKKQGMKLGTQ